MKKDFLEVAQAAAALGENLRVKVSHSQKLVNGVLKEKGLVEIQ
jgi:flagella basal body P-ring formation protein FlgA